MKKRMVAGVFLLLAAFMAFMAWRNYTSQVELRSALLNQLKNTSIQEAASFSHFFSDRQNDLKSLQASRELSTYFESKDLGMSKEYGLWASLIGMSELFGRYAGMKTFDNRSIYLRIAFVNTNGDVLADDKGVKDQCEDCETLALKNLSNETAAYFSGNKDGESYLIMVLPYRFKDSLVGYLYAWLNAEDILPHLIRATRSTNTVSIDLLIHGRNIIGSASPVPPELAVKITEGILPPPGQLEKVELADDKGRSTNFLLLVSSIESTPFSLVKLSSEQDIIGPLAPWELFLLTIVTASLLLIGGGFIFRTSERNLILNVRVQESARQAATVEEKNRLLEQEIQARRHAETALQKINNELEERVRQRTADLEERSDTLAREAEERRKAESTMRLMFNKAHSAICIFDLDGAIIDVNDTMLRIFEVKKSKALELTFRDISSEENDFRILETNWERAKDYHEVTFEWNTCRPGDKTAFQMEVTLNRIEMSGRPVIIADIYDVSEHKRIQAQQGEHQEFLNTIFEGIGAAIFVFDPTKGSMVESNSVGESLLSMTAGEINESSCRLGYSLNCGDTVKDLLCPDWHEQGSYEECLLELPDSPPLPVSRHLFEVYIGGKSHLVQVIFDITERKNLERTLNVAQKLESIGLLASGIAHEINTPIQYVGDSIRFVKEVVEDYDDLLGLYEKALSEAPESPILGEIQEALDDMDMEFVRGETPKACERAIEGVERVATIVLAMKNFSHPGEEKPRAVDINKAIENTVTVTRNEWKYVADLETELDQDLPLVHCFPGAINQVLLNIIVNAAHAISERKDSGNKGTISVSTDSMDSEVEIRISDSGVGIPKKNISKIFDPFFTTKEVGKGTGQGLAIVHDIIVDKHGGSIDIESEEGKGTTFILRLPISADAE